MKFCKQMHCKKNIWWRNVDQITTNNSLSNILSKVQSYCQKNVMSRRQYQEELISMNWSNIIIAFTYVVWRITTKQPSKQGIFSPVNSPTVKVSEENHHKTAFKTRYLFPGTNNKPTLQAGTIASPHCSALCNTRGHCLLDIFSRCSYIIKYSKDN